MILNLLTILMYQRTLSVMLEPRGPGGPLAPPIFVRSVNPIPTGESRLSEIRIRSTSGNQTSPVNFAKKSVARLERLRDSYRRCFAVKFDLTQNWKLFKMLRNWFYVLSGKWKQLDELSFIEEWIQLPLENTNQKITRMYVGFLYLQIRAIPKMEFLLV